HNYPPTPSFRSPSPPPPTSTLFPYTTLFRSPSSTDNNISPIPKSPMTATMKSNPFMRSMKPKVIRSWPVTMSRPTADDLRFHRRSEEHTSELQSRGHLVCRLLLEKKKKK